MEIGSSPLAAFWAELPLYCCSSACPTLGSAVGQALGYAHYAEIVFALALVAIYILFSRKARHAIRELLFERQMARERRERMVAAQWHASRQGSVASSHAAGQRSPTVTIVMDS